MATTGPKLVVQRLRRQFAVVVRYISHPKTAQQFFVWSVELRIDGGVLVSTPIAWHDVAREQNGVKGQPVSCPRPHPELRTPGFLPIPTLKHPKNGEGCFARYLAGSDPELPASDIARRETSAGFKNALRGEPEATLR